VVNGWCRWSDGARQGNSDEKRKNMG